MQLALWAIFLAFAPLHAATERQIHLITTWRLDPEYYTTLLTKNHIPARVSLSDFNEYEHDLHYTPTKWQKFLRKFSLDSPPTVPLKGGASHLVFFNLFPHFHQNLDLRRLPKNQLLLFLWEPPNVLRKMYKPRVTRCFSRVYTWNDDLVDNLRFFKFYYPVLRPMITDPPPFEEKKICTLIASNLFNNHPTSLYKERRNTIAFFEHIGEPEFEFYGRGWDATQHPSYHGPAQDTVDTLKHYRFSICYENSSNIKGYITEKIFNCFAAGNVPVYWGASNVEEFIPKNCFVDRRDFSSLEELYRFLKAMTKEEYEGYIERIRAFLDSEPAQLFSTEHFEKVFCEAIRTTQS